MSLPTIHPKSYVILKPEPLTPSGFEPFGTVITAPLTQSRTSFPSTIPTPLHPNHQPRPVPANQSTALKTSPVSPLINEYPIARGRRRNQATAHPPGKGLMSIFSSFPRRNIYLTGGEGDGARGTPKLKLGILERHPYTTQTFCPFNYSIPIQPHHQTRSTTSSASKTPKCYILIIVAPTLPDPKATPSNPPDLTRVRAFVSPLNDPQNLIPNIAVTYNAGTWHAPMIVLGDQRVDFLVTQFANGVGEDDCQEVLIGSGPDERVLSGQTRRERSSRSGGSGSGSINEEGKGEIEVDLVGIDIDIDADFDEDMEKKEKWTTDEMVMRAVRASKL